MAAAMIYKVTEIVYIANCLRACCLSVAVAACCCNLLPARELTLELSGNGVARNNAIAAVVLPDEYREWNTAVVTDEGNRELRAQISHSAPRELFVIVDQLGANESRKLHVREAPDVNDDAASSVRIVDRDGGFYFLAGGKTVMRYNHAIIESPAGLDPVYRRSGHIHPLFSPSGRMITDDFCPSDHTHQHGVMFAWTNCSFEGRDLNFWEQQRKQGIVRHAETTSMTSGPVFAELNATIEHIDVTTDDAKTVLSENWRLRVYNFTDQFVFDLESQQSCVADSPLTINQYHYGGMAIRGNRNWTTANSGFRTSNGKSRSDGNHDRPNWCDMHGKVDGKPVGVTLFCHPKNLQSPQPVRLHPSMPYFCYAPLVLGEFQIGPMNPLVSNYRFVTHDGEVDPQVVNQIWLDYAQPIQITVVTSE